MYFLSLLEFLSKELMKMKLKTYVKKENQTRKYQLRYVYKLFPLFVVLRFKF